MKAIAIIILIGMVFLLCPHSFALCSHQEVQKGSSFMGLNVCDNRSEVSFTNLEVPLVCESQYALLLLGSSGDYETPNVLLYPSLIPSQTEHPPQI